MYGLYRDLGSVWVFWVLFFGFFSDDTYKHCMSSYIIPFFFSFSKIQSIQTFALSFLHLQPWGVLVRSSTDFKQQLAVVQMNWSPEFHILIFILTLTLFHPSMLICILTPIQKNWHGVPQFQCTNTYTELISWVLTIPLYISEGKNCMPCDLVTKLEHLRLPKKLSFANR